MSEYFAAVMELSTLEIDYAQRYWACKPTARATGDTRLTKQKERLSHLEVVWSWVSDFKPAGTFAKSLTNPACTDASSNDLSNEAEQLARKIIDHEWCPSDPSAPLRGNSRSPMPTERRA